MPRNNKGCGVRRKIWRSYNPKFRRVRLTSHAKNRLSEPDQAGLTEIEVIRAVKAIRGSFFNDGEAVIKTISGKTVIAIFTDTLETRNVLTLVGEDRMPRERRLALAATAV